MARNGPAIPRYRATHAPAVLQQGFRPFFLGAGLWAIVAMALWLAELRGVAVLPAGLPGAAWHAHALLFGYLPAALAGFLLTAVPNWTGRMPLQGAPLLALVTLWLAGRAAVLLLDGPALPVAAAIDVAFPLVLTAVIGREIGAGRNWRNLLVLAGVAGLAAAQVLFWLAALGGGSVAPAERLGIAVFALLIALIGGRITPSFTRNWLKKHGAARFPVAANNADRGILLGSVLSLASWVVLPQHTVTAALCALAAVAHLWRLSRWRGLATRGEPLLLVLHLGYLWLPVGLALVAAAAVWPGLSPDLVWHALTAGAMGTMTLAVMTRATRGHTGRPLSADRWTTALFAAVTGSALLRLLAPLWPGLALELYALSGALWIAAFVLFILVYAPMLLGPKRT
jgi:uncharacterized protein involved in response to NO